MNNLILLAGQMHNDQHANGPAVGGGVVVICIIILLLGMGGGSRGGR